jgi:disulfide bond formation protein DsbB
MQETIELLNFVLALGGVAMAFGAVVLFYDVKSKTLSLRNVVTNFGLLGAFLISALSVIMTLVYSEVFGFIPCGLCWLQRVFLYPQVILLGMALWKKDTKVAQYGIGLSIPGLVISLYQHYLQMGGGELIGCPTAGAGADCAERILFEFGFMTFPLMSAFLFLFLIALYYYLLKTQN